MLRMLVRLRKKRVSTLLPKAALCSLMLLMFLVPQISFSQYVNNDIIVNRSNDSIACNIERVDATTIYYHIQRMGPDPKTKLLLAQVVAYKKQNQWYYSNGLNMAVDKARDYIIAGRIQEAIASYAQMIARDSMNAVLLAEGAYALALGGIYDAAMMRLDHSWSVGANAPEVNYFMAQVFLLMGYEDLSRAYWIPSAKYFPPEWIARSAATLLQKYKRDLTKPDVFTKDELVAAFRTANLLASNNQNFQSILVFRKIIDFYSTNYLPLLGYSIVLEKTGAISLSAQSTERALSAIGTKPEDAGNRQILEQRATALQMAATRSSMDMPGITQRNAQKPNPGMLMIYAGGMAGPEYANINGKFGYVTSGSSNVSIDFGVSSSSGNTSFNLGFSGYYRLRSLVSGVGFLLITDNQSTSVSTKISVGISKLNKKRTSSFDLFFDINAGLSKGSITTFGISVGKTIYFGKRK